MENTKIKPCPFCGKVPEYIEHGFAQVLDVIKCEDCELIMISHSTRKDQKVKLIDKWNKRF